MQSRSNPSPQIWHPNISFMGAKEPKIGKWNDEQKKIFNLYSKLYENILNKYELMAQHIPTRTPCQIRSHWQKFNERKDRQRQRIGKKTSRQDTAFGNINLQPGFQFFNTIASDIRLQTEEWLLKMKSLQQNFMSITQGKPKSFLTKSIITRRSQTEVQIDQEVFWGGKKANNFIIVQQVLVVGQQKGEQLQKVGKGGEESNTLSNVESMERENASPIKKNYVQCSKSKRIHKREKMQKR